MRFHRPLSALLLVALALTSGAASLDDLYQLGPDSQPTKGVPEGKIVGPLTFASTKAYPGTTRNYWIYVPAQYDGKTPAALMVFQDGHYFVDPKGQYRIPVVFDNLIYRREMPVTIGVFINPGRTPEQQESSAKNWGDSINNRATEYNPISDTYPSLICDELLPAIKKGYVISDRPEDRAIAGASSGAIAAWTVAWHRPDQFRKVISTIGSFTNIRGGHRYPDLVAKTDAKPIRVYLEDGANDNRGMRGKGPDAKYDPTWDWHLNNRRMLAALTEKKYDVNFCWGLGTHSNRHGGAIMPEMLRWLWRDYPRPDDATTRQPLGAAKTH